MTDPNPFPEWIGRASESEDLVTGRLAASFRAILAPHLAEVREGAAPLGLHWCLSPAIAAMSELGGDGHPARNRDLPPVPLPRRMWAGGEIEALAPLAIGNRVRRTSTIADITRKEGKSGELWFVAVRHDYSTDRGLAIRERHDIVYREAAQPAKAAPPPPAPEPAERPHATSWTVSTSPILLFRYSAITFNGHRIHYDLPYATGVEGYPGLVVHGPIQATLLYNLAASRLGAAPKRFTYRALAPAFAGTDIFVRGDAAGTNYWTQSANGLVHMEATASA